MHDASRTNSNSMKHLKLVLTVVACTAAAMSYGQTPPDAGAPKADNTKVNERDRNAGEVTADQQKATPEDRKLTKRIRQSIMADKSLSTYAHNIKVVSQNGAVTLKGPVKSDDEKRSVVAKAVAVAGGPDKVTDQISIAQ